MRIKVSFHHSGKYKHRIVVDFLKYFNSLSSGLRITGSNWNRKLAPKDHARSQFCSDPVRSHAYFPEWKSVLTRSGSQGVKSAIQGEGLDGGLSRTVNIKFFSKLTVTVKNLT